MSNNSSIPWCGETAASDKDTICVTILSYTIHGSDVRVYDLCLFLLSLPFLLFLIIKLYPTIQSLRFSWRKWPLFTILYCLVWLMVIFCSLRCILAMTFGSNNKATQVVHFLWKGSRLATEISVVVFGLMFKYYQDQRCRLTATIVGIVVFSSLFTIAEGVLTYSTQELACKDKGLFIHGGMIFLFVTSTLFALIYLTTFSLYLLNIYKRWNLPSKKSFYRYALFLFLVNVFQAVGSMMWYNGLYKKQVGHIGICFTMITTVIYFITFPPVVYWIFLRNYFRMAAKPPSTDSQHPVNVSRSDSMDSEAQPRRWRWPLKPTKSISIRPYSYNHHAEESSRLINSYGSYSSMESECTPRQ